MSTTLIAFPYFIPPQFRKKHPNLFHSHFPIILLAKAISSKPFMFQLKIFVLKCHILKKYYIPYARQYKGGLLIFKMTFWGVF